MRRKNLGRRAGLNLLPEEGRPLDAHWSLLGGKTTHGYVESRSMTVDEAVENWVNGNRSDVLAEVCDRVGDHAKTAWFAVEVYKRLEDLGKDGGESAADFARALYRRGGTE